MQIRTFILGLNLQGSTAYLQAVANAGVGQTMGNAPYYNASNPQQLVDAFNTIINGVISCDLTINQQVDPASAPGATVTLNGMNLTFGTDWTLDAERHGHPHRRRGVHHAEEHAERGRRRDVPVR